MRLILLMLSIAASSQDVPFLQRSVDKDQDLGGFTQNFRSATDKGKDNVGGSQDVGITCFDAPTFCVDSNLHVVTINGVQVSSSPTTTNNITSFSQFNSSVVFTSSVSFTNGASLIYGSTGSIITTIGQGVYLAKSVDGVTQSSGCVGNLEIANDNTLQWTSSTTLSGADTKASGILAAVNLTIGCVPGSWCMFGTHGIYLVRTDADLSAAYAALSGTRCLVTSTTNDLIAIGQRLRNNGGTTGIVKVHLGR